jgi:cytochrome c peroxidase
MQMVNARRSSLGATIAAVFLAACGGSTPNGDVESIGSSSSPLTAQDRLNACAQDPRVVAGLVTARICAGADIFFRETFNGNGRTCGTCHPVTNNTTIDVPFITALHNANPADPLFVFDTNPNLTNLEKRDSLLNAAVVLENVDGFEDPVNKFVLRSVPHVLSLQTSITADDTDPFTTDPPRQRTGWGGDGAPGDGSLLSFLTGAVTQHYTNTLTRTPGVDFRLPTSDELDLTSEFQLALGRLNELDLTQVNLFDSAADTGRQAFMDPARGRCNFCHFNAGANAQDTGKNRNFDTGLRIVPAPGSVGFFAGVPIFDGGFGVPDPLHPNINALSFDPTVKPFNAFGNGSFNTPPLIEAADTKPFFHNQFAAEIEDAVFFYIDPGTFQKSQAEKDLVARFGTPINFSVDDGNAIGRFLRALNIAFNLDIAKQRLNAALTLFNQFGDTGLDVQIGLLNLANAEIDDALEVLTNSRTTQPFYPVSVDRIGLAQSEIAAAIAAPASSRGGHISNAVSRVENARDPIGANVTFNLGQGNLMF